MPSCNYFFCTGVTKTSRGEADITRKCGLYKPGTAPRVRAQPVVLRGSRPQRREPKQRAGRLYDWKQFRALWDEVKNVREIARVIGCNPDTVQKWRHGEELRADWADGLSDPKIAAKRGVSPATVLRMRREMGLSAVKGEAK